MRPHLFIYHKLMNSISQAFHRFHTMNSKSILRWLNEKNIEHKDKEYNSYKFIQITKDQIKN